MKSEQIWRHVHAERGTLADTWAGLTPDQWATDSWAKGWSVHDTAGHVVAAAEQTPLNFYKELIAAGFRFDVFTGRAAKRLGQVDPSQLVDRLRARTTTTNHPPAPVLTMLGEVIVHGEDIRRPLGLHHDPPEEAVVAVADGWKKTNLVIGSKRRISGVRLRSTDIPWSHGAGPEVAGPLVSIVLAMTGRKAAHADLRGDGLAVLAARH